ncbi:MAG: hypothetical protein RL381_650 [Actinomycetota bacterium]
MLPLLLVAGNSYGAVKTGAVCAKAGMKKVSDGLTYTCKKSGKKLVWDKGVVVMTYPDGPTSFDDLVENYRGISYAAWSKSSAALKAGIAKAPAFKAITGPNTVLTYKTPTTAFDLIARLYSGYESSKDATVLSFNFADREWARDQMKALQPNSTFQWIMDMACATKASCNGGGMFTDDNGAGLLVITTEVADVNHTSGTLEAHEYTHAVQQGQMKKTQPWPTRGTWPPTWYLEGQAHFAQNAAVYYQSFESYASARKSTAADLFVKKDINSKFIEEYFLINQPSDWFNKYDRWRQYDLGAMLVETLVAVKGPAPTMEIWKLCGSGMTFEEAFAQVYGTSFYSVLPKISKAIALEVGRS